MKIMITKPTNTFLAAEYPTWIDLNVGTVMEVRKVGQAGYLVDHPIIEGDCGVPKSNCIEVRDEVECCVTL
jgi:altronate dehydratase